jgi:hypothetical protein
MVTRMDETQKAQAAARREAALQTMGLTVLLERNGGRLRFTKAEYEAVVGRYGGSAAMAIHMEVLAPPGQDPDEISLTLIRKEPGQGDLVS